MTKDLETAKGQEDIIVVTCLCLVVSALTASYVTDIKTLVSYFLPMTIISLIKVKTRVTSDSSSDQNPHGLHRTTCESSLPTTTRVKSPPSPLTSDGFVAKRLEKIAKEVESIIVSQHFSSFDQELASVLRPPLPSVAICCLMFSSYRLFPLATKKSVAISLISCNGFLLYVYFNISEEMCMHSFSC
ncbi:hypothetical protein Bca4012_091910 [Brassica carinata]